jgi:TRAP transporter TAXI family solute receptor
MNRIGKKLLLIIFLLAGIIILNQKIQAQTHYNLTWVPTGTSGTTYGVAVTAATIINKYSPIQGFPKLQVSVVPGKGTTAHTAQLIRGEIDIGLSSPTIIRDAYAGKGEWGKFGEKGKELRVLLPATIMAVQIYSLWEGPVKNFLDIRGRRLGEMSKAMSMQKVNAILWKVAGLDPDKDMKTTYYSTLEAQLEALRDGHADAIIQTQGYPATGPMELFTVKHCRVIPIPVEITKKVAEEDPSCYPSVMPANTYPKQDYSVTTVGPILFWGTTTRLSNEVAYQICKILNQHYKEGVEMFKPFGQFRDLFKDFGIPYHQGAEKYWREVGLIR